MLPRVQGEGRPPWGQRPADREGACLTCDVEVGIACSFSQLVGDDALVDAGMLRSHGREHQAMDIPVWGVDRETMTLGLSEEVWRGGPRPPQAWPFTPTC